MAAVFGTATLLTIGLLGPVSSTASAAGSSSVATTGASAALSAARAGTWAPKQGAFFNLPRSKPGSQFRAERQVIRAIRHMPRKSRIRMSMFSFDRGPVADALIAAHRKRKVRVQVIVNGHEWSRAQHRLRRVLGGNRKRRNFLYHCKNGSCRARGDAMHSKFITFTRSGRARNVVMLGSINMKMNGHKNQYNDLWVKNNVPNLHDYLVKIFNQMRQDRRFRHGYRKRSFPPKYQLQVLPYGGKMRNDPIIRALRPVRCHGARTRDGRTRVRVNMHAWTDSRGVAIAKRLRYLYGHGCNVKIQYGMAGKRIRQALAVRTKRGLIPVRSSGFDTNGNGEIDLYSHMKMLMVRGHYWKKPRNKRIVWTGSSNYQRSGKYGDELIFRIISKSNQRQYAKHWEWMWRNKTRKVIWMRGRVMVNGRPMPGKPILFDPLSDNSLDQVGRQG